MDNPFTRHPSEVGESYAEHLLAASRYAARLLTAAFACLIHAIFPFACVRTGSGIVRELHEEMRERSTAATRPARSRH